jgi:polysaccharide export outer membrane protein
MRVIRNIRPLGIGALFLCGLLSTAAQQQSPVASSGQGTSPSFHDRYPRYTLRSGDSFDLTFDFSPEFNQSLIVQPDGFVTLREVGDIHVSGLTLGEVQRLVLAKYSTILKQPVIVVTPKDLDKSYFIATGEVSKPGKYELRGDVTLTQAIAMAGGFTQDRAKHSEIVLFHRQGDQLGAGQVIDLKKMLKNKNLSEDALIKPGDLVYVPQNAWSKLRQILPTPGVGMQVIPGATF